MNRIAHWLGCSVAGLAGLAGAQPSGPGQVPLPPMQVQHDWGCEVLLCLSNPNGPRAVRECDPPINRLYDTLAHGHGFPSCTMSNGQSSRAAGAWASPGWNLYDPCPAGTQALPAGQYALPVSAARTAGLGRSGLTVYAGIGDGSGLWSGVPGSGGSPPPEVCVGRKVGQQWVAIPTQVAAVGAASSQAVSAGVYDAVTLLPPNPSGNVVDVYVDNRLYRRVRW